MSLPTTDSYEVQIISSLEALKLVSPEWENFLETHASEHTYRQDPCFIRSHLGGAEQDKAHIFIIRKNNAIKCIAPCVLSGKPFKLIFSVFRLPSPPLRVLRIQDSDFIFSQNANINECISLVLSHIKSLNNCDVISLEDLRETSSLYTFFSSKKWKNNGFRLRITSPETERIHRHKLQKSYDSWLSSLRRKTRGTIRRHIRRLEKRSNGQAHYMHITRPADIPNFLTMLDQVYSTTWQAKTFGYSPRNTEKSLQYYKAIAAKGWLRSYLLLFDKKPVAFIIGYQYNGIFEYSECGYDPDHSKLGVGSVLNYHMLQDLYDQNSPRYIDFGFGENQYKRVLGNEECNAFQAYITFTIRSNIIIKGQQLLGFTEKQIRALMVKFNIDNILRKILKRR